MDTPNHKCCTKCGVDKVLDEFSADKKKRDGKTSHCKACVSEFRKHKRNGTLPSPTVKEDKMERISKCCTKCGVDKGMDEYFTDKTRGDGKVSQCKTCRREYSQQVKNKNKEEPVQVEEGTMKTCRKCTEEKPITEFYKENITKSGYKSICKVCSENQKKVYIVNNIEKVKQSKQRYYDRYYMSIGRFVKKEYRQRNKEIISEKNRIYRENNIERLKEKERENRPRTRIYLRHRRRTNIQYKLATSLRNRFSSALRAKRNRKTNSAISLLGCTLDELRKHLENKFVEGMSWDNYGEWEIDHILPVASFDLRDDEQQQKCFHFTNLQPLWAEDNRKKGCKILNK